MALDNAATRGLYPAGTQVSDGTADNFPNDVGHYRPYPGRIERTQRCARWITPSKFHQARTNKRQFRFDWGNDIGNADKNSKRLGHMVEEIALPRHQPLLWQLLPIGKELNDVWERPWR